MLSHRSVRVAALGSTSGLAGDDIGPFSLAGPAASRSSAPAPLCFQLLAVHQRGVDRPAHAMFNGVGVIWRVSDHVLLIGELSTMVPLGTVGGEFNGALAGGGLRLHYDHWAFDFSLLHALESEGAWRPYHS